MKPPALLYGTAWKEDRTEALVYEAIGAGFRGIDTANQRKHYHEAGVGHGVRRRIADGTVARDDLFLQTKFTFRDGQDHRLPYDPTAPIEEQVAQSFESSLEHLGVERIDSLVLHGPSQARGLGPADWAAWRAIEAIVDSGRAGVPGVSNVSDGQLDELIGKVRIRPAFVQNRCYAVRGWDRSVRAICKRHGVVYQGFSLLTANRQVLANRELAAIAEAHGVTRAQVVFRFAIQVGMLPLTGTTDPRHMREDLAVTSFELPQHEVDAIEAMA